MTPAGFRSLAGRHSTMVFALTKWAGLRKSARCDIYRLHGITSYQHKGHLALSHSFAQLSSLIDLGQTVPISGVRRRKKLTFHRPLGRYPLSSKKEMSAPLAVNLIQYAHQIL